MKITLITSIHSGNENTRLQQEAQNLGHSITILDPRDLTISITNGKLTVPELDQTMPEVVILRGVLVSVKKIVALISYCHKKQIRVFDNNLKHMQYSINKTSDLIKLATENVPVPDTRISENYRDLPRLASEIGYPLVAKPIDTGKGLDINLIHNQTELISLITKKETAGTKAKRILLQRYLPYQHDLRVLVIGQNTFCMERIPPEGDFRANYSLGGSVKLFNLDDETHTLAIEALNHINMSVGGVDILITKDNQKYVLEVNHSPGFEGMEKATGKNIANLYLTHALNEAR